MRRMALTAAALSAALIVTGCSGDDSADTATTESAPAAESEAMAPEGMTDGTDEAMDSDATDKAEAASENKQGTKADKQQKPKAEAAPPVPAVLDFTSGTVDGGSFDGASLAGEDSVLFFWAPWCSKCRAEAPTVAQLAEEFEGRAEVVGVAGLSTSLSDKQAFVSSTGLGGMTHLDDNGDIYTRFGVVQQHTYGFVDDNGDVQLVGGPMSLEDLRQRTQAMLAS